MTRKSAMWERNPNLHNRIYNEKYRQTSLYLKGESKPVKELLGALERTLGNIGWWDCKKDIEEWVSWEEIDPDDLRIILKHALQNIGYTQEEEE